MVCGILAGVLWYDYEYTQDKHIKEEAEKFTNSLEFLSRFRLSIMIWDSCFLQLWKRLSANQESGI